AKADFDRVGIMVFGDAEHQEIFCMLPIRLAKLPEGAADRINTGRRHVDRTETAVGGVVARAILHRPPAGEALRLVAAGEKGKPGGILGARRRQPFAGKAKRLVPFDLDEFSLAPLALAQQRLSQTGRGMMLHDPGRSLGAKDALVHRMIGSSFDVAAFAVLQMHTDAAAAGTHIAGRVFNLVRDHGRSVRAAVAQNDTFWHLYSSPATLAGPRAASTRLHRYRFHRGCR